MYKNNRSSIDRISGIVARDSTSIEKDNSRKRGVIGRYREGRYDIPWRCRRDMTYFREMTDRGICVMGRNTYLSLPQRLSGRREIVISTSLQGEDVEVYRSIEECFDRLIEEGISSSIYVIGGNRLLQSSIVYIDDLYLTTIDTRVGGDSDELVYLDIELPSDMRLLRRDEYLSDRDDLGCVIEHYARDRRDI